jgi:hypothetical protein
VVLEYCEAAWELHPDNSQHPLTAVHRPAHYFDNPRIVGTSMKAPEAVAALAALAHEHRLAVYRMLVEAGTGGLPAGEICRRCNGPD